MPVTLGGTSSMNHGSGTDTAKTRIERSEASAVTPHILVVDDDSLICQQLERLYQHNGYQVSVTHFAENALQMLEKEDIDLVVTDIQLPGLSGIELTRRIMERWSSVAVIVMTGYAEIDDAVQVLKIGAGDYIIKPFTAAAIQESTGAVLERASLFTEIRHLRRQLKNGYEFGGMLSQTEEMHKVFEVIRMVAPTNSTVVIEGETGTGKELVASAIHHHSTRGRGPFVTINCGGLPESLLESELFGFERGSFTGADHARPGKIEQAHGGTLFFDEIENMPLSMQAKLLLALNDQRVQRLGSSQWIQIDMRVIAATNVPLRTLVNEGKIRRDFYYRINVVPIFLIPLRQRLQDIPILVQDFIRHHRLAADKQITNIAPKAMAQLMRYHWPGNVRELQNVLEKAMVLTKNRVIENVELSDLELPVAMSSARAPWELPLPIWMREQEKSYLVAKLNECGGRIDLTATKSGIDVRSLHRKMRFHGLDKKSYQKRVSKPDR
jgi:two-component system, NtrC family, response regulator AtoC